MEVEALPLRLPQQQQQQQQDFNFDSTTSSPYITAPSSPQLFGFGSDGGANRHHFYNLSAPTSPTGSPSTFFRREFNRSRNSVSSIPFDWEEKPGIRKHHKWGVGSITASGDDDDSFEFDFSGQLDIASCVSASADELFDGGKIRPLKLPPRLQVGSGEYDTASVGTSPRTPPSRGIFSPKKRVVEKDFDPFTKALDQTRKTEPPSRSGKDQQRGRDRNPGSSSSSTNYIRRGTRSLSPFRVSDIVFHDQHPQKNPSLEATKVENPTANGSNYFSTLLSSISLPTRGYRKWSFRDFLLFRSASEGRGTSSDPLRKCSALNRKSSEVAEDSVRSCSFRSTESTGSSVSGRRRGKRQSAHEVHYTMNRAASEEMRKKTFLPYKQGLLGCLGFNPGLHEVARSIGSMTRGPS